MKIIIHAGKDEMILAARVAQTGLGLEERGEWPKSGWTCREFENGKSFTMKRNATSITIWSQAALGR